MPVLPDGGRSATLRILVSSALTLGFLVSLPATAAAVDTNCPTASAGLSGAGTSASPYLIQSKEDLQLFKTGSSTFRSQEFRQTQDISMQVNVGTDCTWDGGVTGAFSGTYDGGGFEVSGVNIVTSRTYAGFFEEVNTGAVRNLGFTGSVTSTSTATTAYVGGLVGRAANATIENTYATGDVSSSYTDINYPGTGGLVGYARENTDITGSYATGNVSAVRTAGGFIGRTEAQSPYVEISTSYATGDVQVSNATAGGFAGHLRNATVWETYASGDVSSTNTGQSNAHLGAFAGVQDVTTVTDSYALGGVSGGYDQVGGFVGDFGSTSTTTATRTYTVLSSGLSPEAGASSAGGFVGYGGAGAGSGATTSFWDYENTPYAQDNSGTGSGISVGAKGRSSAELRDITTYTDGTVGVDWNASGSKIAEGYDPTYTWGICAAFNDGYPFLTAIYSSDPCSSTPAAAGGAVPDWPVFTFQTPGGGECTEISPQHPRLNSWFTLPDADAPCFIKGSVITGWSIPGQDWAFAPGRRVWVVDSQTFTSVLEYEWVTVEYDSNVDAKDACLVDGVDLPVADRTGITHIPRGVITEQPLWKAPVCAPAGWEFTGWTTDNPHQDPRVLPKDGTMPAPAVNSDGDAANTIHLYAIWKWIG